MDSKFGISVGIPIGPLKGHRTWLQDALQSCANQTVQPEEVILVVDGKDDGLAEFVPEGLPHRIWVAPWTLGSANAFNHTVGLSKSPYIFLLASDDTLEPTCLEKCQNVIKNIDNPKSTIVWVGVRYMANGETQALPCGAMMVPKVLWERIDGYPLECIFGAPDHVLFSSLLSKGTDYGIELIGVQEPVYNYRTHPDQVAVTRAHWHGVMGQVRDILQKTWAPKW